MSIARPWPHLLTLTLLLCFSSPAHAKWSANGNAVCRAPGAQGSVAVLADGSGGAYVVWLDERRGARLHDLFATRIDADGSPHRGWPSDGLALAQTGGVVSPKQVVTASGALVVAWFDSTSLRARVVRVDGTGAFASGFAVDGVALPIEIGGRTGNLAGLATDGGEGAYLLWISTFLSSPEHLLVTRLAADATIASGWTEYGVLVSGSYIQSRGWGSLQFIDDRVGGAWLTESHVEAAGLGYAYLVGYQRHVMPDATVQEVSLQPAGYPNDPLTYVNAATGASDGSGGAFAVWMLAGRAGPELFLRHHLADATPAGPAVAVLVFWQLIEDGAGGVYLLGPSLTDGSFQLHRRDATLNAPPGWENGVVFPTASYSSGYAITAVRSGPNVYVAWRTSPNDVVDLRASSVTSAGTRPAGWGPEGTVVSEGPGNRSFQGMAAGSAGDAYAAWVDTRSGDVDVYLARLGPDGPIVDATLSADLDITPRDPERLVHGRWVRAWIEPHAPQLASQIDVSSLRLNGVVPVDLALAPRFTDHDRDGIAELQVNFDRAAVAATMSASGPAIITVSGLVDGQRFTSADTLLGGHPVVVSPQAGTRLDPGTVARLEWQIPEGIRTARVALLASLNAGRTWETIAPDIAVGSNFDWSTPTRPCDHVLLAVTMTGEGEGPETLIDGLLGMSPEIQIGTTLGVGDRDPVTLALRRSTPNPQRSGRVRVDLALAGDSDATLELLDVSGRTRVRQALVGLAAGAHSVELAPRGALPPGLYFVRLTQAHQRVTARLIIVD